MSEHTVLDALRSSLTGSLLRSSDDAFDQARLPWNRAIDQRPAAVATPADIADLRLLLQAARDSGAPIAVQPSGHGASGDLAGAIIVRMAAFDQLDIDLTDGVAVVGAGVAWGRVVEALEGTGWAAPAGTSPVVSATGYTLGGGHSWFSRTAGLGSDNLRAAWVLRADGTHDRVDDDSDPDLLWALRGAGGLVGIVTALEIELVRTPDLWGASLVFDAADSAAVLRAVRDLAVDAPATLNVFVNSMRLPDAPQLPTEIRGQSFLSVQAPSVDGAAEALLEPVRRAAALRRAQAGSTSPLAVGEQSNEPTDPSPSRGAAVALASFDDATIDSLTRFHAGPEQWPIIGIDIRMLGGALDAPRRPGFASLRSAAWMLHALAPLFPGAPVKSGDTSLAAFRDLLSPFAASTTLPTFLAPHQTLELCASPGDVERLRALRALVDPERLLHEGRLPR
ncbi:FAD-binding oxidoreductase [Microbacterium oxydans]|uniref:FAD-binding oxidoreductase n=1 Tax=Microbacterium oxydans TaxID=82380 RepID=UPI000695D9EA|nr:FAD-binding protein [Microbacterium oxydans]